MFWYLVLQDKNQNCITYKLNRIKKQLILYVLKITLQVILCDLNFYNYNYEIICEVDIQ